MENDIEVSIVILTKNAETNIRNTLSMVLAQNPKKRLEVIVIDSGSTDRTVGIINSFPDVKLVQRSHEEFHHGRTRNLGGKMARGKYLVFLNGDAIPKDEYWLSSLLDNFGKDEKIAGVYSRHIPKEDCRIYTALQILTTMIPVKEIEDFSYFLEDEFAAIPRIKMLDILRFSTVSCAIQKRIWGEAIFTENLSIGEDREWAKRILEKGYKIVYEPSSIVLHSHNYSIKQTFKYHYDNSMSFNMILNVRQPLPVFLWQISTLPLRSFKESISIIRYGKKKGYTLNQIMKEVIIAACCRLSALFGEMCGNKLDHKT